MSKEIKSQISPPHGGRWYRVDGELITEAAKNLRDKKAKKPEKGDK